MDRAHPARSGASFRHDAEIVMGVVQSASVDVATECEARLTPLRALTASADASITHAAYGKGFDAPTATDPAGMVIMTLAMAQGSFIVPADFDRGRDGDGQGGDVDLYDPGDLTLRFTSQLI